MYMHYCFQEHHIRPNEYMAMDINEKASIIGSAMARDIEIQEAKKNAKK